MSTDKEMFPKEKLQRKSVLAAQPLDFVTRAELKDINSAVNDRNKSGKKKGGLLYLVEDNNWNLVVAYDEEVDSGWRTCLPSVETILPAGTPKPTTQSIGDGKRTQKRVPIVNLALPVVPWEDLAIAGSTVNDTALSGKQFGSLIASLMPGKDFMQVLMAQGSTPIDEWRSLNLAYTIVPLGEIPSQMSIIGQKAISHKTLYQCTNLPVIPLSELRKADSEINDTLISGKKLGSMIIVDEDVTPVGGEFGGLAFAKGPLPTDDWARGAGKWITPTY